MALYLLLGPFYVGPVYTFLAPFTTTPSTPSWPLLLRPLLHFLGPFYCWSFCTFLALYYGPLYTLAPLSRPFLHLGPSITAPSTPSWSLYYGPLLHLLGPFFYNPFNTILASLLWHPSTHNHVKIDVFLKKILILGRFLRFFLHLRVPSHAGDLWTFLKLPQAFDVTYRRAKRIFI